MTLSSPQQRRHKRMAENEKRILAERQSGFRPTAIFDDPEEDVLTTETVPTTSARPTPSAAAVTTSSSTPVVAPTTTSTSTLTPSTSSTTSSSSSAPAPTATSALPTTSTTSSTPLVLPTITPKTTAAAPTIVQETRTLVTSISRSSTATSSSASASSTRGSSNKDDSSSTTGTTIGIIGGVIVGIAIVCVVIAFVLRRFRNRGKKNDEASFNPDSFRRSAYVLDDNNVAAGAAAGNSNADGNFYNNSYTGPRPPSMVERRRGGATPDPTQYANTGYNGQQPSFGPGQIYNANGGSPPPSAHSANALMYDPNSGYPHNGPMASPVSDNVPHYAPNHNDGGQYVTRQASVGGGATGLARKPSFAAMAAYPTTPGSAVTPGAHLEPQESYGNHNYHNDGYPAQYSNYPGPVNDYADLTRSSVTPYQAAQYADISNTLHTSIPQGLDTPSYINATTASPFADPANNHTRPTLPALDLPAVRSSTVMRESSGSYAFELLPPVGGASSPIMSGGGALVTPGMLNKESPLASRFPVTPSPMASTFDISSVGHGDAAVPAVPAPAQARQDKKVEEKKRPDTVYDEGDAYGGM